MSELPSHYSSRAEMDFILQGLKQVSMLRINEIAAVADHMPFLQEIDRAEALQGINSIITANRVLPDINNILVDSFFRLERIPQGFVQPGDGAMQIGERIAALETPEEQDEIIPKF